ncbi:hypothetical protein J3R03_008638 [Actinoplanes couchii]|nr:hypothetical protein [Actinoplanes couchii]
MLGLVPTFGRGAWRRDANVKSGAEPRAHATTERGERTSENAANGRQPAMRCPAAVSVLTASVSRTVGTSR